MGTQLLSMRLIQQEHSKYKRKKYHKSWVVIPQKIVDRLGWKKGDELGSQVKGDKLIIEKD